MEKIIPDGVFADPIAGRLIEEIGVRPNIVANWVVLFTDLQTVAAARAADLATKTWMMNSGIGLVQYSAMRNASMVPFLIGKLHSIDQQKYEGLWTKKHAVLELHRAISDGYKADFIQPNPFLCALPSVFEPFVMSEAIEAMARQARAGSPPPEPKPSFGKRK